MTIAIQEVITNPDITKIAVVVTDQTEVVTTQGDLGKSIWEFEIWLTNFVLMVWIWRVECKTEWAKADQGEREFYFACEKKIASEKVQFFIWLIHLENILHILKTGPSIPWKHLSICRRDNISYLSNCFFNSICFSFSKRDNEKSNCTHFALSIALVY